MQHFPIKIILGTALLAGMLCSGQLYATSVFKWTDENGVVHYGDKKPQGAKSEKLKVSTGKPGSYGTSAVEKAADLTKRQEEELEDKAQQLKLQQRQASIDERCKAVRDQIRNYKNSSRMRVQENGEYRYLSDEEKAARQKEYEKILADECGG